MNEDGDVDEHARAAEADASAQTWKVVAACGGIVILAVGWYVLSRYAMGSAASDAFGEALGVTFGLLIVVSVIGAVRNRDRG